MKEFKRDLKNGQLVIRPETTTDLYVLMNIIQNNDKIISKSSRRIKRSSDDSGSRSGESSERITMTIGIVVEDFKFQDSVLTDRLRIKGRIYQGPEQYVSIGGYHTLNVEVGTMITIIKDEWSNYHFNLLKEAEESQKKPEICLISIDEREVSIGILDNMKLSVLFNDKSTVKGKREKQKNREANQLLFLKKILSIITRDILDKTRYIIVGGPGFSKEKLGTFLRENITEKDVQITVTGSTSSGSKVGLYELTKTEAVSKIAQDFKIIQEEILINEFVEKLSKGAMDISYGIESIREIASTGAIEKLIGLDRIIHGSYSQENTDIKDILREIEKTRGKIVIIPSKSENARKLQTFGGLIAFLRYSIHS